MIGKVFGNNMILPAPDYPTERARIHESIGTSTPLAADIVPALLDIGMVHGFITKRRNYASSKERTESRHTFILLLDGRMDIRLNGQEYQPVPGQLTYYPAETTVFQSNPGESWFIILDFRDDPRWGPLTQRGEYIRTYEAADLMYLLMKHISAAYIDPNTSTIRIARRKAAMLADLIRHEIRLASHKPSKHDANLQRLLEGIRETPQGRWTLPEMAARVNVSVRTLNRMCQKNFGITPMEMVIRERMSAAYSMFAQTDKTVSAVAQDLGYESVTSFCRLFKRHTGKTPRECRANG